MRYRNHFITTWVFCCCLFQLSGQITEKAIPFSVTENLEEITWFEDMPDIDTSVCNQSGSSKTPEKQSRFACPINTDLDPDNAGEWTETPNGGIWRLGIRSRNAYSLYISLNYSLLPGARLFVYSPGYRELRGSFTSRNNNPAKVLSIAPVSGERLIVELNMPPGSTYSRAFGELKIIRVYHDYQDRINRSSFQGRHPVMTDGCTEDINCENGLYWQTEKRAVCKIISNGGMGTGTLIGNTSGNSTPFVLSAHHLIPSAEIAAEAIFLFNYETSGCQGELTTVEQSLSGATLLSTTNHQVDFSLMKLNEKPPEAYQPYYAGWDARNILANTGACIHHPFGSAKQIAIEYHLITSENIGQGFDANSTWKISHWELGTTELGSSGAPLFNDERRIIGTLTGGRSTCGYSRDDYFTKFGVSWNAYPGSANQLKYWLDSAQTGQLVLDGYDPYGFNAEYCDTAWNIFSYDRLGLSNKNLNWGWVSGHNSAGHTQFAERFESTGALQVNGAYLRVAKAHASNPLAHITLKVWEGDQYPEREWYSALLFIRDFQPDKVHYIPFDSVLTMSGPFFIGYEIGYEPELDTFALYHTLDRGNARASSMYVYNEGWYRARDKEVLDINTSLGIGISECYGKTRNPAVNLLNVYPNPCTNSVTLDLPGGTTIYDVKCLDNTGRPMRVDLSQTEAENKLHFNLRPGMYHLQIITAEKSFAGRFIVLAE